MTQLDGLSDDDLISATPTEFFDYAGAPLTALPGLPEGDADAFEDYIYVLRFGDVVKVGISKQLRGRIGKHIASDLARRGPLTRVWISSPHVRGTANETALIHFCRSAGTEVGNSIEWFAGIDVERVIAFARTLPFKRFEREQWDRRIAADVEEQRKYTARTGFGTHVSQFFDPNFVLVTREMWERTKQRAEIADALLRTYEAIGATTSGEPAIRGLEGL